MSSTPGLHPSLPGGHLVIMTTKTVIPLFPNYSLNIPKAGVGGWGDTTFVENQGDT